MVSFSEMKTNLNALFEQVGNGSKPSGKVLQEFTVVFTDAFYDRGSTFPLNYFLNDGVP